MTTFTQQIEKYARLAVEIGANVQDNQNLVINAPLEAAPLVREIVKQAYLRGARNVYVDYNDEQNSHTRLKYGKEEALTDVPEWLKNRLETLSGEGAAFLHVISPNPDLMKDIDPKRLQTQMIAMSTALQTFRSRMMSNEVAWSIIAVPTAPWATKVFPGVSEEEAIAKLWEAIFKVTRVDLDDPVAAWKEHNATLYNIREALNAKRYKALAYEGPGTNLTVELVDGHIWAGGKAQTTKGVDFNPNMPTEEVFTMPHKNGVNGTVSSTLPLNYQGNVINNFKLTFKDGEVVEYSAEEGYEVLKSLLETDAGARRLGEVALVPHNSPISNSGIVFYNTLFDENASCHLAFGNAYAFNIEGGTESTKEQLAERGSNESLTHVDFMIGEEALNIYGVTAEGEREPIILNGNWAIEAVVAKS